MFTIFVVDDTESCRKPMARLLRMAGYDVLCACNGLEALAALETVRPALILLDLAMPVMDGLTFLGALRDDPRWVALPVIVVSGETPDGPLKQAGICGADEVMAKGGFRTDELFACIRRHISGDDATNAPDTTSA
jgi:CheY-like chemotaxis protein